MRMLQRRLYVKRYKEERGCMDCGERDVACLEFDHRDRADKTANIAHMVDREAHYPDLVLLKEMAKCDVVCANCHAKRTAKQFEYHARLEGIPYRDLATSPYKKGEGVPERRPPTIRYVREQIEVPVGYEKQFGDFWAQVSEQGGKNSIDLDKLFNL